jgi:hypothetical protein
MAKFFVKPVFGKKARDAMKAAGLEWPSTNCAWILLCRKSDGRIHQVGKYKSSREEAEAAMAEAEKKWKQDNVDAPITAASFPKMGPRKKR